jgi:predicted CXXCH cytochrome family protein
MLGRSPISRLVAACVLLGAVSAAAQTLDTAIFGAAPKEFTILDQIERPKERSAFEDLYKMTAPAPRLKAAQVFLTEYPDSWLLAEVYEIAAKASIDLGELPAAISYARQSLRLFPENPLLLVPLANAQLAQGLLSDGEASARDALEYLDRFKHPSSVRESEWPAFLALLKASSFYVMAKASLSEALSAAGDQRRARLQTAAADLSAASRMNPADAESAYLLGLTRLSLNDPESAARAFAAAARLPGPRQAKALARLHELGRAADSLPPLVTTQELAESRVSPVLAARQEYAGSEACRSCHSVEHAAWQQTGMARMLRPYRPENVFGDFTSQKQFEDSSGRIVARMWIEKDRHYFSTRGTDGTWVRYRVDYTIGSKWQQAYATQLPDGQIHVFPIQYNKREGAWVNYWKIIDPPQSERADADLFHTMSMRTNYQTNCAPCHTSQLHTPEARETDTRALVFREPGVDCEMCHGPSARHVEAMAAGAHYAKLPAEPPVDFARLDNRQFVEVCAQCHMQSAVREPGPGGEWNYSESSNSFPVRYQSRPFVDFSIRAHYKDGRFRETTFIVEAFMRSACYRKGPAHCGNCHNPHSADAATNPASLKFQDQPDQMCLQCHARYVGRIEAHTRHPASSEASRCVSCHMPRIMNSLLFVARSHQIDDIPTADMTARFGQTESPNACLSCHQEKDAKWIATRLQSW